MIIVFCNDKIKESSTIFKILEERLPTIKFVIIPFHLWIDKEKEKQHIEKERHKKIEEEREKQERISSSVVEATWSPIVDDGLGWAVL